MLLLLVITHTENNFPLKTAPLNLKNQSAFCQKNTYVKHSSMACHTLFFHEKAQKNALGTPSHGDTQNMFPCAW